MADFAKTSTATAHENSGGNNSDMEFNSPAISATEGATKVDEMDIDMPDRPSTNDSLAEVANIFHEPTGVASSTTAGSGDSVDSEIQIGKDHSMTE